MVQKPKSKPKSKPKKENSEDVSYKKFADQFGPIEWTMKPPSLLLCKDQKSGARFCECHIMADKLIALSTTDVPLDPEHPEYRANRELVTNDAAFHQMKDDAVEGRIFNNIVAEFVEGDELPLKIIGGQHRFEAIKLALEKGVNNAHGVKVYLDLDMDQRLDVQLISNTNIAISRDLYDRLQETFKGPELRDWCQRVGLLMDEQDFADRGGRGRPMSVRDARTFICNYYRGMKIDAAKFDIVDTTPIICDSGDNDREWEALRSDTQSIWSDSALEKAGKEFARLVAAQRAAFAGKSPRPPVDYPEKAFNGAILASWAYVAGILHRNKPRLDRHYSLAQTSGKDPLNASALAKGRHRTDPENYRGLGYRTDNKERGRLAELFFLQAESGSGITPSSIDIAIKKFHAKQAQLEVQKAQAKV